MNYCQCEDAAVHATYVPPSNHLSPVAFDIKDCMDSEWQVVGKIKWTIHPCTKCGLDFEKEDKHELV